MSKENDQLSKILSVKTDRRLFLKLIGAGAASYLSSKIGSKKVEADSWTETYQDFLQRSLDEYLAEINEEREKIQTIVENQNIFWGFKNLSLTAQSEDFDMYFPMYKAGELKYDIPWYLLWIIHEHETTASRDNNPWRSGYKGAMQREPNFYSDKLVEEIGQGWELLTLLPQRYYPERGLPYDSKEILFAAWKLNQDASRIEARNPTLTFEDSFLSALYSYSASWNASQRIAKYQEFKNILA